MAFKIEADDFKLFARNLEGMTERAKDLSRPMSIAAQALDTVIKDGFRKEQDPYGKPWDRLSEVTKELRRKGKGNRTTKSGTFKILQDTRKLFEATNTKGENDGVVFGVSGAPATYAGTHLFGRDASPGGKAPFGGAAIPRRAFLPVDEQGTPNFDSGKAAKWFEKARNLIINYVVDGIDSTRKR